MSLDILLRSPKCCSCGHSDILYEHLGVTHNLIDMAKEAEIYYIVWRPEESGIAFAAELINPIEKALCDMKKDPGRFKAHNPSNGWGSYDGFIKFLEKYLQACKEHPDAEVFASR